MPKSTITVTYTDGTKKVIVGIPGGKHLVKVTDTSKPAKITDTSKPYKVRIEKEEDTDKRAKPPVIKAGLTKERNPYKYGGKAINK